MKKTLIKEISENDLQAVVDAYTLDDFYYPSIFPVMFTPTLTWGGRFRATTASMWRPMWCPTMWLRRKRRAM